MTHGIRSAAAAAALLDDQGRRRAAPPCISDNMIRQHQHQLRQLLYLLHQRQCTPVTAAIRYDALSSNIDSFTYTAE